MSGEQMERAYEIEVTLRSEFSFQHLTRGWTEEERQAALEGDPESVEALEQSALTKALTRPDYDHHFFFESAPTPQEGK